MVVAGSAENARISADGSRVVYEARGLELVPGFIEYGGYRNIYVYDVGTDTNTLVSHSGYLNRLESNYNSFHADISGDGSSIIWMTWRMTLLRNVNDWNTSRTDTNGYGDVYLYNVSTGRNSLLSRTYLSPVDAGNEDSTTGIGWETQGRLLSENGSVAVFESLASDIASGDLNGLRDVFVASVSDLQRPTTPILVSNGIAENQPSGTLVGNFTSVDPVEFLLANGPAMTTTRVLRWLWMERSERVCRSIMNGQAVIGFASDRWRPLVSSPTRRLRLELRTPMIGLPSNLLVTT